MKDQPEERAERPGLKHQGQVQEARWRPPGMDRPEGRGAKRSQQHGLHHSAEIKAVGGCAPWTGGAAGRQNAALDWIIRGGRRAAPDRVEWVRKEERTNIRSTSRSNRGQD